MPSDLQSTDPERQRLLRACEIADTPSLDVFERAVRLASQALNAPVAVVGLRDGDQVRYGATVGTEVDTIPVSASFFDALNNRATLQTLSSVSENDRLSNHPVLEERPALQFVAGQPLVIDAPDHLATSPTTIGILYVADTACRSFHAEEETILRDLAAPVMNELERRAYGQRERAILEHTSDASLALDAKWRITHLNARAEALLQRDTHALLGQTIWKAFPQAFESSFEENIRRAAAERSTVSFETYYSPLETWFQFRAFPVAEGLTIYFEDVTQRRESVELLESINANISEGLFRSTPSDGFVYANSAFVEMFGYEDRNELLDVPPSSLYADPEGREAFTQTLEENGIVRGREIKFERRDGSSFWGLVSCTVVRDEEDHIRYYDGAVVDITNRKQRKKQLRILERALDNAAEAVMIIETTSSPQVSYVNEAFSDMMGYSAETVLGETPKILEGPATDPDVLRPLIENKSKSTFAAETVNYDAEGESLLIQWNLAPVRPDDRADYWIAVLRDVTEHRRMELEIREREQKVEALYAEAVNLLQADSPEDVAAHVEDLVIDTLGYPLNAVRFAEDDVLVPAHVSEKIQSHMPTRPVYPIDGESIVAETFRTGETRVYEDIRNIDDGYDRGDARATAYVPIGPYGLISVASLDPDDLDPFDIRLLEILTQNAAVVLERIQREDRQRRTIERIDTLRDISQSILSASSTKAVSHATLQRLAPLVPYVRASVVQFDRDDEEAALLAVDDPEAPPPKFEEALPLEHFRDENGDLIRSLRYVDRISASSPGPLEEHLQTVGIHSYLNVPLRAEDDIIGALNLGAAAPDAYEDEHLDIAQEVADMLAVALRQARYRQQLIDAKEEAEEMNRLKSAFLANMSHEIRTPLTSIIGFADVLGDYDLGEADRFADLIEKSGTQLLNTIDSVLDLSKLEAGSVQPTFERLDVAQQTRDAAELVSTRAEEADVSLDLDVPDDAIQAELDQGAFHRILQNLLSNAIKFTDPGGTVTLRARQDRQDVVLEVQDTGVGIDEAFMPNLFNAFEQENDNPARNESGTGLGLAVTKRLVDLLDGTIDVESSKGKGTCFTVRLPRFPNP